MKTDQTGKLRVILAKLGLDGHDRGVQTVARALRDAGLEVIYLGRHLTPEEIVNAAIQEDADFIGVSNLVDSYVEPVHEIIDLLKQKNASSIKVVLGGLIIEEDIPELEKGGCSKVFPIESRLDEIVSWFQEAGAVSLKH